MYKIRQVGGRSDEESDDGSLPRKRAFTIHAVRLVLFFNKIDRIVSIFLETESSTNELVSGSRQAATLPRYRCYFFLAFSSRGFAW